MSNAFDKASLVMLPHAYEEGKLYSLKPTDRSGDFTFSRGSDTATRVGEDGYIKKEIVNLLEQSNSFLTSPWTASNGIAIPNQPGYDGSNNAWQLNAVGSGNYRRIIQNVNVTGVFTFSIYAKANTTNILTIWDTVGSNRTYFDLSQTDPSNVVSLQQGGIDGTPKAESIGDGWWRLSMSFVRGSTGDFWVFPVDASGNTFCTDGNGVYIQDAMLNQGLVAYPYIETTTAPVAGGILEDMPRLDWSGSCPALLLEPQRTNLITHSEYLEGGDYSSTTSFTYNTHISPEGVQNALTLADDSISGIEQVEYRPNHTAGTSYVFSMFVKKDTNTTRFPEIFFRIGGGITQEITTQINTSTGAKIDNISTGNVSSEIINFSDDYWRVIIKAGDEVSDGNTFIRLRFRPAAGDVFGVQNPTTTGSIITYGWQLEQDATYPTSYIPTYGTSQTRLRDVCETSDIASLIGQTEGTFVVEIDANDFLGGYRFINLINNSENRITLGYFQNNRLFAEIKTNNVTELSYQNSTIPLNQKNKIAIAYRENDCRVFINGQKIYTDNSVALPSQLNKVSLDVSNFKFYGNAHKILTFTQYLSDDECIALTAI